MLVTLLHTYKVEETTAPPDGTYSVSPTDTKAVQHSFLNTFQKLNSFFAEVYVKIYYNVSTLITLTKTFGCSSYKKVYTPQYRNPFGSLSEDILPTTS